VHALKSEIFQRLLSESTVSPRPGVVDVVTEAKNNHHKVGFVTTTSQGNIDALLAALQPHISAEMFDLIVDREAVEAAKPNAAAYVFALEQLGERADSAVAIEDNVGGVAAAVTAGIHCIAFPNENTDKSEFTPRSRSSNLWMQERFSASSRPDSRPRPKYLHPRRSTWKIFKRAIFKPE
jgi:HAD superfamily hydrolase (TIGR01509 family)